VITVSAVRTLDLTVAPPVAGLPSSPAHPVNLNDLAQAAALELRQNLPSHLGLCVFLDSLLHPGSSQLQWLGRGPGVGREIRRSMSALLGRFMARWFAHQHLGITSCIAIDRADLEFKKSTGARFRAKRVSAGNGDMPDWVWFGPSTSGPPAGFLEATGSFTRSGLKGAMTTASAQVKRMEIWRMRPSGPTKMQSKNWAIGTGWWTQGPINGGFHTPEMHVVDPVEDGAGWDDGQAAELVALAMRRQLRQSLDGLGLSASAASLGDDDEDKGRVRPPRYPGRTGRWRTIGTSEHKEEFVATLVLPPGAEAEGDGILIGYKESYVSRWRGSAGRAQIGDLGRDFLPSMLPRAQAERLGGEEAG